MNAGNPISAEIPQQALDLVRATETAALASGRWLGKGERIRGDLEKSGTDTRRICNVRDLVRSEDVFFAATGISGGTFLGGVDYTGSGAITRSLVIRGKTGTVRYLESLHQWDRLMRFSSVKYD